MLLVQWFKHDPPPPTVARPDHAPGGAWRAAAMPLPRSFSVSLTLTPRHPRMAGEASAQHSTAPSRSAIPAVLRTNKVSCVFTHELSGRDLNPRGAGRMERRRGTGFHGAVKPLSEQASEAIPCQSSRNPPITTPKHYHAWKPALGGRGQVMVSSLLTRTEVERQEARGSNRLVRRWFRTRQAAHLALRRAVDQGGHVRECDLGVNCPGRAHILGN